MTDATAQYILKARDDSRGALASFKRGFDDIDKSVRVATRSLNLMTEIFVGARIVSGIKRFTTSVIEAAAASDKDFGSALTSVKEKFDALLAPKAGMAGATDKMKELADTLSNPATLAAADKLTSALITGFATVAKYVGQTVAGLGIIAGGGSQSMKIDDRMQANREEKKRLISSAGGEDKVHFSPETVKRLIELDKEYISLSSDYESARKSEYEADLKADAAAKSLADSKQRINDIKAQSIMLSYSLKKSMDEVDAGGKFLEGFDQADKAAEKLTQTTVENQIQQWNDFYVSLDRLRNEDLISQEEYNKRSREFIDTALQEIQVTSDFAKTEQKKSFDEMTDFARQAASSTQQVFADFLFDPFHAGLKGMVIDFANILRRLVAEAAAADLMKALFGTDKSGQAGMSFFAGILGAIFGGGGGKAAAGTGNFIGPRAGGGPVMAGGAYLVGENGPEMFFPGSSGNIAANGSLGGDQISIVINNPVDARGAQEGQALQLARVMRANNESLKQDIFEGLRRRKYRV